MAYTYGKPFMKNGKSVRYRYTNGRKSTKKLVAYNRKRKSTFRGKKSSYRRY